MLQNIESVLYEIKNTLLDSEDLRKLLFYDTSDALSRSTPLISEVENYILLKPVVVLNEESSNGITTFISIGLLESELYDNSSQSLIKISIATNRRIWELDDLKIRPISIAKEVKQRVHNKKFSSASPIQLSSLKEVYFNSEIVGFLLMFDLIDEEGDIVNEF
jgi:hypothetical protein